MHIGEQKYFDFLKEHGIKDTPERRDWWKLGWNASIDYSTDHMRKFVEKKIAETLSDAGVASC